MHSWFVSVSNCSLNCHQLVQIIMIDACFAPHELKIVVSQAVCFSLQFQLGLLTTTMHSYLLLSQRLGLLVRSAIVLPGCSLAKGDSVAC